MKYMDTSLMVDELLKEISYKAPLHYEECIEIALLITNKVLGNKPTLEYWNTCSDETPSAIIVWNEVKARLEELREE